MRQADALQRVTVRSFDRLGSLDWWRTEPTKKAPEPRVMGFRAVKEWLVTER